MYGNNGYNGGPPQGGGFAPQGNGGGGQRKNPGKITTVTRVNKQTGQQYTKTKVRIYPHLLPPPDEHGGVTLNIYPNTYKSKPEDADFNLTIPKSNPNYQGQGYGGQQQGFAQPQQQQMQPRQQQQFGFAQPQQGFAQPQQAMPIQQSQQGFAPQQQFSQAPPPLPFTQQAAPQQPQFSQAGVQGGPPNNPFNGVVQTQVGQPMQFAGQGTQGVPQGGQQAQVQQSTQQAQQIPPNPFAPIPV